MKIHKSELSFAVTTLVKHIKDMIIPSFLSRARIDR